MEMEIIVVTISPQVEGCSSSGLQAADQVADKARFGTEYSTYSRLHDVRCTHHQVHC